MKYQSGLAEELAFEELIPCLEVKRKIEECYLRYDTAYTPESVPGEHILRNILLESANRYFKVGSA